MVRIEALEWAYGHAHFPFWASLRHIMFNPPLRLIPRFSTPFTNPWCLNFRAESAIQHGPGKVTELFTISRVHLASRVTIYAAVADQTLQDLLL